MPKSPSNQIFDKTSFLHGANATYVEEMFKKYSDDPSSVPNDWGIFFKNIKDEGPNSSTYSVDWAKSDLKVQNGDLISAMDSNWSSLPEKIIRKNISYSVDEIQQATLDSIRVLRLIRAFRVNGHLIADLDPLQLSQKNHHPELDYKNYGFNEGDLEKLIFIDGSLGLDNANLKEIIKILHETYSSSIGVEFLHIQDPDQKQWVQERIEEVRNKTQFTVAGKRAIYRRLLEAEMFENYLDKKFLGTKRFGLVGSESTIPGIEQVIKQCCLVGIEDIYIGTAHRGRLTLLASVMEVPLRAIMTKFQGGSDDPNEVLGSGDVKYHLGVSSDREFDGKKIHLSLTPNPSHLEAVDPVVIGKVRAKQTLTKDKNNEKVIGILIHGDAAIAGQGVVAETFAMSQLRGFRTGGTVHFVINNQIGFTTMPLYGRSAPYCTEIAKIVQAPIFHVNGDDPEAVVHVCRLAAEFRNKFKTDVIVDMFCYRRAGHNEMDLPEFTQPLMYKKIKEHSSTLKIYEKKLIGENILSKEDSKKFKDEYKNFLDSEFSLSKTYKSNKADWLEGSWKGLSTASFDARRGKTAVEKNDLISISVAIHKLPEEFTAHKRIKKIYNDRSVSVLNGVGIDWATAEALAFASLLSEGFGVRLSGQDVGRGTFSQRHAVLYDQVNEKRFVPLRHFQDQQGLFEIVDSFLSEYGVLGFEYGYSQVDPKTLVLWEGQFGDFANNAQTIIDQFITTGERKWLRMSGLTLLLPHGHEGQGPEHTSGRVERFLQMCAEDNIQVINCTSPGNYFHALRRQLHRDFRKPLIIMTPKSTLRHKKNTSKIEDFINGSSFHRVMNDQLDQSSKDKINRVLLCSGKIYFEIHDQIEASEIENVAILRLDQLYPFPYDALKDELEYYKNCEIYWVQEEPSNMGAYFFVKDRVESVMRSLKMKTKELIFIGRRSSASPATGVQARHTQNQKNIIDLALKADKKEIYDNKDGVSLLKYELPIE
ncbi:MAG: 2-oxoglutarate dehydrogenase E1 component [Pelagibacterales bacterium]|nr:2-oxoglutarate dehydrogenase E1 component [Pelagibacterales bacterium]